MDPTEFIKLAGKLAASQDVGGAVCRSSISRAYYGAFHVASAFLAQLGYAAPRTANVHVFVQHHLMDPTIRRHAEPLHS